MHSSLAYLVILASSALSQTTTTTAPACIRCTSPCPSPPPATSNAFALCGDTRLGPTAIPSQPQIASMFTNYSRFGQDCPQGYFDTWLRANGTLPNPPQQGFTIDSCGIGVSSTVTIPNNTYIDRFGRPDGTYVSLSGRPFSERSIPPSNIVQRGADGLIYGKFLTIQPIENVTMGYIAPWYGQPGEGIQYILPQSTFYLADHGYLQNITICNSTVCGYPWPVQ